MTYVPNVWEETSRGTKGYDLFSRMLEEHIIMLQTPINDTVASLIITQMLYLQFKNADKDIQLYVNSPGGEITALFAIYDTMQFVQNDIQVVCIGQAASAAAVLLSAGTKGKRLALPHSRIMLHQPYGGVAGQASDIEIQAREILRMREEIDKILSHHTGQPMERVSKDTDRDFYMSAQEALEYGIIDEVISNKDLAAVPPAKGVA
ncbi:MAG TPA: ATP-dependent Clp protease proteolytic subunit [Acidimicrobiales bacterium]|nr:ATP-dependent Clp protease proteolytic subunit [Acidimicrobiales bacterium]